MGNTKKLLTDKSFNAKRFDFNIHEKSAVCFNESRRQSHRRFRLRQTNDSRNNTVYKTKQDKTTTN